jgi:hypothetical protein
VGQILAVMLLVTSSPFHLLKLGASLEIGSSTSSKLMAVEFQLGLH